MQTLTLSLKMHPLSGTLLESTITGIRRCVKRQRQARGWHQRFIGSWARLNCENMPVIPAWLVRRCLDDPRKIPYLLVWKDERHDGEIKEAVRLARYLDPHDSRSESNHVELKRTDGSATVLRVVWRMLPRNGGRALFLLCPYCDTRAVTSMAGSGTAFRDGQTESGKSVGAAGPVLGCDTLPRVAIFALQETCHGRTHGFLTFLHPFMMPT